LIGRLELHNREVPSNPSRSMILYREGLLQKCFSFDGSISGHIVLG